jgi:hypothetical protein
VIPPPDLADLPAAARKAVGPDAPAAMRTMAARGVIPGLKPAELVTVVALLTQSAHPDTATTAAQTLRNLPPPMLAGALGADLDPFVIEQLSSAYYERADVVERLLRLPRLPGEVLESLAERASEAIGELIATNEERLLRHPAAIEKLYMNRQVRMSTSDRLIELAVRNGLELAIPAFQEAAAAIRNELIVEPTAEPTPDDMLFRETDAVAQRTAVRGQEDDTHEIDAEGEERVREEFLPLFVQISRMTVTQKIRRATLGTAAERLLLVRDPNRLVSRAAAKSPLLRESEAVLISGSRSVDEDVLRLLATNRELTRNYQVKVNLVSNPKTPFTFSSRLIPHLRDNDLKLLAKSKNVSSAVAQALRQHMSRKQAEQQRKR